MTPVNLVKSLPKWIKVGPYDVEIRKANDHLAASEAWGQWDGGQYIIYIRHEYPNKSLAVSSLLHEITHAGFTIFGYPKENLTEEQVCLINDMLLVLVFKDNVWLLDWIKKGLK